MDYRTALTDAGRSVSESQASAKLAEEYRDTIIYQAHIHGGLSTREIGPLAGISHQRAGQIIEKMRGK